MATEANPFTEATGLLAHLSLTPDSKGPTATFNERGVDYTHVPDYSWVRLYFAGEGGAQGVHGEIVGRAHFRRGHNWQIYELYPNQTVWNFTMAEDEHGQPQTADHWLDEDEVVSLLEQLQEVQTEVDS